MFNITLIHDAGQINIFGLENIIISHKSSSTVFQSSPFEILRIKVAVHTYVFAEIQNSL